MRRALAACLIAAALVVGAPALAGAQTTTTAPAATTTAPSGTDATMPVEPAPTELAHTGPRGTTASLAAGFLLLGLGMLSLGAARRMLSHERR